MKQIIKTTCERPQLIRERSKKRRREQVINEAKMGTFLVIGDLVTDKGQYERPTTSRR